MKSKELFPFLEGDDYWTLEDNDGVLHAILSTWDDLSEELHTLGMNNRVYFRSLEDLIKKAMWSGEEDIVVSDYRLSSPYKLNMKSVVGTKKPNRYKRVFQISFDIAETEIELERDRENLIYSIENLINNFCTVEGVDLDFHCVNADFPIQDMGHAYGENELNQLND